ncbi:MAG TPA: hypothetical protein VFL79_13675 [Terriglobia bacterium]|nr:hypothetical protein [Terriglobia bacterium]
MSEKNMATLNLFATSANLENAGREFSEEGFRDAAFSVHLLKNIGPKDLITMKSIRVSEDATMGAASRMVICDLVAEVCHYRHSGNS